METICTTLFEAASVLFESGNLEKAVTLYKQILAEDAKNPRALHALGVIAFQSNDIESAIEYLLQTIEIQPDCASAYCSLGKIQRHLRLLPSARLSYQKAIELEPASIESLYILGAICRELDQFELAEEYLQKALTMDERKFMVHFEFGCLFQKQKQYEAAIDLFSKAIELKHDYTEAYEQLSQIYYIQGRLKEANDCLRRCITLKPESAVSRYLLAFSLNYEPGVSPFEIYTVSSEWARLASESLKINPSLHDNTPDTDRLIRIGFVSPDFRRHPVGYFVQSFMMLHDRDSFEVFCYSDVKGEDELTQSLIESAEKWRRIYGVKDDKLADMIRRDRIDVLVDLAGHTQNNRLNVFILKPAPIQVTWAGYVGTTGLSTIDYLISDRYQSPNGAEEYTVERIIRMPDDYVCYTPPEHAPEVVPLPALTNGYVTFGSFNNLAKLSSDAVSLWCEILKSVPNSRLFIKNPSFSDQYVVERYLKIFEAHDIPVDRIQTEGQSPPDEMLSRYGLVDIHLDTMPYSGGLTTLESLWMGVPVITLPGVLFSSRHSLTHLMNVGLTECVASSREEYVAIAIGLASDLTRLSEMRKSLRNMMAGSPVCDGFGFTENLQRTFREMWREWCETGRNDDLKPAGLVSDSGCDEAVLGDHIEYNEQGNRYSDLGQLDAAMRCYRKALNIKPGYVEAYYNIGLVYIKSGKFEDALRMFRLVICFAPDFTEAYDELKKTLLLMGRGDEAPSVT